MSHLNLAAILPNYIIRFTTFLCEAFRDLAKEQGEEITLVELTSSLHMGRINSIATSRVLQQWNFKRLAPHRRYPIILSNIIRGENCLEAEFTISEALIRGLISGFDDAKANCDELYDHKDHDEVKTTFTTTIATCKLQITDETWGQIFKYREMFDIRHTLTHSDICLNSRQTNHLLTMVKGVLCFLSESQCEARQTNLANERAQGLPMSQTITTAQQDVTTLATPLRRSDENSPLTVLQSKYTQLERSMSLIQEEIAVLTTGPQAVLTTGPQQQDDTRENEDNEQVNTENGLPQ